MLYFKFNATNFDFKIQVHVYLSQIMITFERKK